MRLALLFAMFTITTLVGCAATGPIYSKIGGLPDGHGVVYLYRTNIFVNRLIKPGIIVDNQQYSVLPPNGYMPFVLSTGQHSFSLLLSDKYKGNSGIVIDVSSASDAFIRLETSNEDVSYDEMRRVFRLVPVVAEIGASEIKNCRYVDPKSDNRYSKSILVDN